MDSDVDVDMVRDGVFQKTNSEENNNTCKNNNIITTAVDTSIEENRKQTTIDLVNHLSNNTGAINSILNSSSSETKLHDANQSFDSKQFSRKSEIVNQFD